ncbi:MAG: hypothetical protein E7573_04645 [Ruminococcaceae bacterium]|nr:hypothetical protein [Oscillospiraceae bacterium]
MAELDELFGNEKQTTIEPYSKDDWIKQKNENRALAYEMLETATEELNNPDTVMAYLDIQSKFDRYSVSNALLVAYQNPEATRLCDSKTWQKNHVFINKGETGIIILEPGKAYTREDGKTVTPYNAKKVFDISQTNARPRQNRAKTPDARVVVKAMITTSPVPVKISNELPESVNAKYQPEAKMIFIRQGLEGDDIVRALSKEIAFARLDNGDFNRENLEFKAQAISYIATSRAGFEPEPITILSDKFSNLDAKEKRAELSQARDHANTIANTVRKALEPKNKEHSDR